MDSGKIWLRIAKQIAYILLLTMKQPQTFSYINANERTGKLRVSIRSTPSGRRRLPASISAFVPLLSLLILFTVPITSFETELKSSPYPLSFANHLFRTIPSSSSRIYTSRYLLDKCIVKNSFHSFEKGVDFEEI